MFAALYPFFFFELKLNIVCQAFFIIFPFYLFFCLIAVKYMLDIRNHIIKSCGSGNIAD